jgi:hypothetical protein
MILELELAALLALEAYARAREIRERRRFRWLNPPATPRPNATPKPSAAQNFTPGTAPAATSAPALSADLARLRAEGVHVVEVIKRDAAGAWQHVGYRHGAHPDVREALATKGLALRDAHGAIREGVS